MKAAAALGTRAAPDPRHLHRPLPRAGGNETGALRLCLAHGMALHYAVDPWEVKLPAAAARGPERM